MTSPTLLPLLDYLKHTLLLGEKPVHTVEGSEGLVEHQGDLQSLPGVAVAADPEEGAPWLVVDRLVKSLPPDPPAEFAAWFEVPAGPYDAPQLRERPKEAPPVAEGDVDPLTSVDRAPLEAALKAYIEGPHATWATREKGRLRTIKVYRQLFAMAETLAQNPDRELVWGWGMAVWQQPAYPSPMCYPLLTQTLDLVIDPRTQQIALIPTAAPVHAELLSFLTAKVPGAVRLKGIWEETPELAQSLTPFQTEASLDFFQQAVGLLDADGQLVRNVASAALPKPGRFLQVVDRWVIFDRKRSSAALIQDMTQLGQHAQNLDHLPPPALALLTPPEEQELNQDRVAFKGVYDSTAPATLQDIPVQELYFPLPFNDGQVRLAENMEAGRSQVVQGPPGTGKSHTIVNVMAHSMARGKSLLVTSKGTPALRVLQEKLPAELRALCVFMLQGEKDGMREFEASIDHLSQQISRLDGAQLQSDIEHSEHQLDDIHSQLAAQDRQMLDVARRHLSPTMVSGQEQAALVLVQAWQEGGTQHVWLDDAVPVTAEVPALPMTTIVETRQRLGDRLILVAQQVPDRVWTETEATAVHHALMAHQRAKEELAHSPLKWRQPLVDRLKRMSQWKEWRQRAQAMQELAPAWLAALEQAYPKTTDEVRGAHDKLLPAVKQYMGQQHVFAVKPVDVPDNAPLKEMLDALKARQAGGSKLTRLWSEPKAVRQALNAVKVDSDPMQESDWPHVVAFLTHRLQFHRLKRKWLALAPVLGLPATLDLDLIQLSHDATQLLNQAPALLRDVPVDGLRLTHARSLNDWSAAVDLLLHWDHLEHLVTTGQAAQRQWDTEWSRAQATPDGPVVQQWRDALREVGQPPFQTTDWQALQGVLAQHRQDRPLFQTLSEAVDQVADAGAPQWAQRLRCNPDPAVCPSNWAHAWGWRQVAQVVDSLPGLRALADLQEQRVALEEQLNATRQRVIVQRTWLRVLERATPKVRAGLEAYLKAVKKIGKGTGKAAGRHRQDARVAMAAIYQAIPCWVMPHDRAIEFLPSRVGDFDLVVLDEASQSDLRALPALLRGKQWLIVGDEKQVSPSNVGKVDEEEMQRLRRQYLKDSPFAAQLTPDNSVYDLCKVALAAQGAQVVLVEHFRCHPAIIEFSNREYYHHGLKALRIQKASEKMDPPLVDVMVQGGTRKGKLNLPEARFIVDEIKTIANDPAHAHRTIGVVSLLGTEQVSKIQDMLMAELGEEAMLRHQVECGDAARFQGKERSIMFLSMVATPDDHHPATRLDDRQRFNVAASRARDRLYLVRSVGLDDLTSQDDQKRKLVAHFHAPFVLTEEQRQQAEQLFDSPFEKAVYERLVNAGYRVKPQVPVGGFRIDLVVLGGQGRKLAVECDGDRFHGLDQWPADMARQRTLERVGWTFWRCFASSWYRDPNASFADLVTTLSRLGIEPGAVADELDDFWVEHRVVAPRVVEDTAPKKAGRKGGKKDKTKGDPTPEASSESDADAFATAATDAFTLEPVVVHFDDDPPQAAVG